MAFSIHLQTRSRRHQRLLLTSLLTLAFILIVIAVLALRPRAAVYQPGESIAGITSELGRDIPSDWPRITFVDKAAEFGIRFVHFSGARSSQLPEDMGSGAAWAITQTGRVRGSLPGNEAGPLTLTAAQIKTSPARCALYHNEGGRFTDVTDSVGLSDLRGCFMGAAWGDYDNDGFPDLFVTSYGERERERERERTGCLLLITTATAISRR